LTLVGIDILSHKICLENRGVPICVLGSGLLNYYPKENSTYFDQIAKNGCLISEYDLYANPDRYNFPARNRIISALGDGLIVVEAKEKSGTMITVKYALDYGKDIAAVPGPIFWEKSTGNDVIMYVEAIRSVNIKRLGKFRKNFLYTYILVYYLE